TSKNPPFPPRANRGGFPPGPLPRRSLGPSHRSWSSRWRGKFLAATRTACVASRIPRGWSQIRRVARQFPMPAENAFSRVHSVLRQIATPRLLRQQMEELLVPSALETPLIPSKAAPPLLHHPRF